MISLSDELFSMRSINGPFKLDGGRTGHTSLEREFRFIITEPNASRPPRPSRVHLLLFLFKFDDFRRPTVDDPPSIKGNEGIIEVILGYGRACAITPPRLLSMLIDEKFSFNFEML
jgi:hypothetical protein